jgi:glycosyltransferase involved in cell wall biosynthesis
MTPSGKYRNFQASTTGQGGRCHAWPGRYSPDATVAITRSNTAIPAPVANLPSTKSRRERHQERMTANRIPVVIAGTNCLSGVTTWADRLRAAMADHPDYEPRLLYIGHENPPQFDLYVPTIKAAARLIRRLAPAIVLPNYLWELFQVGLDRRVFCIGMCHSDDDEEYYRPLSWYEPCVTKFIAVSAECAQRLSERVPFRAQDITTLPYGIDLPPALRRNYQRAPLRIVYAGRVTQRQKRVSDFIPLVDCLVKAEVPFAFDIIGDGDAFAALKNEMQNRFPASCVRFQRRIPHREMPRVWLEHDVFVQTSDFEGTSVSMLEAMAYGVVPAVTAASSGIEGVIDSGNNGFVVPVGDMPRMAQVLSRLATDQELLESTGRAAHQTAQRYSMDLYVERFAGFLDGVVAAGNDVSVQSRCGMFGHVHPLFVERHTVINRPPGIVKRQLRSVERMFRRARRRLIPPELRQRISGKYRRNAA